MQELCSNDQFASSSSSYASFGGDLSQVVEIVPPPSKIDMCTNTDLSFSPFIQVDVCTNTDLSSSPFIQVDFFIPDNLDYGENIDIDNLSDSTACSSERECDMSSSEYSESEPNFESETEIKHDEFEGMKFITFFSSLLLLLKNCLVCGLPAVIEKVHAKGTALCVKLFCERGGHSSYWFSQPKVKDTFMGNI